MAYGRLLRLSLAPSAVADVVAGTLLGAGLWPGSSALWLVAASLCVYHGGMALNDWADRHVDAKTRPDRPLPSGAIAPQSALYLAVFLLAAGPLLASLADPGLLVLYAALSLGVATYDMVGRGPWMGPTLLALCRGGNMSAGLFFGLRSGEGHTFGPSYLALPVAYAAYVFLVSRLGRLEDAEDPRPLGRRPARLIAAAVAIFAALPILPIPTPPSPPAGHLPGWPADLRIYLASAVVAVAAFMPLRLAFRVGDWTRPGVVQAMGILLRRLLICSVAVCLMVGTLDGVVTAGVLLLGYPLSARLRRVFPPS